MQNLFDDENTDPIEGALDQRLPGEQVWIVDSPRTAEVYLSKLPDNVAEIIREPFPNGLGLYARIRFRDRIQEDKIFVTLSYRE